MYALVGRSLMYDGIGYSSWIVCISKSKDTLSIRKSLIEETVSSYRPFIKFNDDNTSIKANIRWSDRVKMIKLLKETNLDKNCLLDSPYGLIYTIEEVEQLT